MHLTADAIALRTKAVTHAYFLSSNEDMSRALESTIARSKFERHFRSALTGNASTSLGARSFVMESQTSASSLFQFSRIVHVCCVLDASNAQKTARVHAKRS